MCDVCEVGLCLGQFLQDSHTVLVKIVIVKLNIEHVNSINNVLDNVYEQSKVPDIFSFS
jgi:hypothetical protein